MSYRVRLTRRAKKALDDLTPVVRDRVNQALDNLLSHYEGQQVPAPDLKQLHGKYKGLLRLRAGGWRVIFKMEADRLVVLVFDVVKRGDAYR